MPLKRDDMEKRVKESLQESGLPMKRPGNLKPLLIRLSELDKKALEKHFQRKGLRMAQGIRMIIREYMEREGVQ